MTSVVLGSWTELAHHARPIRLAVFVHEQHVPIELEWDGVDPECVHAVAYGDAHAAIGTARLLPDARIGRMAVLPAMRGQGVGRCLLAALIDRARSRGDRDVRLSAQTRARGFYERSGFESYGVTYLDAGIEHVDMRLRLR